MMYVTVCVVPLSAVGHRLGGPLGSWPESDLQRVHDNGELAANPPQPRPGVTLQGKHVL